MVDHILCCVALYTEHNSFSQRVYTTKRVPFRNNRMFINAMKCKSMKIRISTHSRFLSFIPTLRAYFFVYHHRRHHSHCCWKCCMLGAYSNKLKYIYFLWERNKQWKWSFQQHNDDDYYCNLKFFFVCTISVCTERVNHLIYVLAKMQWNFLHFLNLPYRFYIWVNEEILMKIGCIFGCGLSLTAQFVWLGWILNLK